MLGALWAGPGHFYHAKQTCTLFDKCPALCPLVCSKQHPMLVTNKKETLSWRGLRGKAHLALWPMWCLMFPGKVASVTTGPTIGLLRARHHPPVQGCPLSPCLCCTTLQTPFGVPVVRLPSTYPPTIPLGGKHHHFRQFPLPSIPQPPPMPRTTIMLSIYHSGVWCTIGGVWHYQQYVPPTLASS